MDSSYYMWGERGLVATFFADLHLSGSPYAFKAFLDGIQIPSPHFPRTATRIVSFIEPDFANTGFGHPDAVLRVETNEDEFVFILEAKRGYYLSACKPISSRGIPRSGYNSSLNGQLELDFALALALEAFHETDSELVEPEWIIDTPYSLERKEIGRRKLKNQNVLGNIVKEICGLPLENYYFVSLTNDRTNPYLDENNSQFFPELFHATHGRDNCWQKMKHQFGWVNYSTLEAVIQRLKAENIVAGESLFLKSMELNRKNMPGGIAAKHPQNGPQSAGSRGTSLIYAPKINPGTFVHFSWWDESCALRDYSLHSTIGPIPQREYATSQIRPSIKRELQIEGKHSVKDVTYWHKKINGLNMQLQSY
jgi:hypothetical protein